MGAVTLFTWVVHGWELADLEVSSTYVPQEIYIPIMLGLGEGWRLSLTLSVCIDRLNWPDLLYLSNDLLLCS